jgi:hypothetical protein
MRYKILITGAGGVTSRAVVRSLKKSNQFSNSIFIGTDIFKNKYEILEGLFDKLYKLPHVDSEKYRESFLKVVSEETPDAVLILTEKEAAYWADESIFPTLLPTKLFANIVTNKLNLHNILMDSNLVPKFRVINIKSQSFNEIWQNDFNKLPVWVRAYDAGSSTGKGSYLVKESEEFNAWAILNKNISSYLISEYLPNRNFACNMLFKNGVLLKHAIYERIEYFMPHLAPSGITGNISVGKLINDDKILNNCLLAIRICEQKTNSKVNGLLTIDLKGDLINNPLITEINLRHTAATEAFAFGNCNMAEYHVLATIGMESEIPNNEIVFDKSNLILRDIDGIPYFTNNFDNEFNNKIINYDINADY